MATLDRSGFLAWAENVWGGVRTNFAADGAVHPVILGVTPEATLISMVDIDPTTQEGLDQVRNVFEANRIVAAIHVGELWKVSGHAALETVRAGIRPRESVEVAEAVFMNAAWPREEVSLFRSARIHREDDGSTRLGDIETDQWNPWLSEILSAAHGGASQAG